MGMNFPPLMLGTVHLGVQSWMGVGNFPTPHLLFSRGGGMAGLPAQIEEVKPHCRLSPLPVPGTAQLGIHGWAGRKPEVRALFPLPKLEAGSWANYMALSSPHPAGQLRKPGGGCPVPGARPR